MNVVVVGGGLAGLTAGAAFAQEGNTVTILERATELRYEGSGIALNKNAQDMLERVGALEAAIRDVPEIWCFQGRSGTGRRLGQIVWPLPILFTQRKQLMQALESVAVSSGAAIKTSVDVEEVSPDGWVRTTNGEVHHADLVVGADGVRSVVRRALPTPAALVPLSFGGAVTLVPRLETDADVSNGYWTEYWSRTRHIYSAPVGGGCTYLAFFSLNFSDWRPHVSATDDTIKWTPLRPIDVDSWSERFPVVAGPLSRIEEAPVWSRFVEVRLRSWVGDRVVVIGDAAHAMAPALGSGGTTAMMDAITLAGAVGDGADLSARLQHWERAQRARVTPVQRSSRRWGRIFHMPTAVQWAVLFQGVNRTKFIHRLRFNYLTYKPVSLKP